MGQIEAFGDDLCADDKVDMSVVEVLVTLVDTVGGGGVAVEAGDGSVGE